MKRIIKIAVLAGIFAIILTQLIFAVRDRLSQKNMTQREMFAMDTVMQLTAYGKDSEEAVAAAAAEISRIDALCDPENEDSDIFKINSAGGKFIEVCGETAEQIRRALQICAATDGKFDISAYPVVKAWGFISKNYRIPTDEERLELKRTVGYEKIEVDGNSVRLADGAQISLAAIAKGYASQRVCEILKSYGVKSAMVWLGGNVQTVGGRPDGRDWQIGIQNPIDTQKSVCSVKIRDKAAVTSGDYQRYFEKNGVRYGHIMDLQTCAPACSDLLSVTIICGDGAYADGLSTALFAMGYDRAIEFYRQHADFDAVLIKSDGTVCATEGIADCITEKDEDLFRFETVGLE